MDPGGAGGGAPSPGSGGAAGFPAIEPVRECGDAPFSAAAFSREALRAAAVDCAAWQFCRFENAASALDQRVRAYVEAPAEPSRELARAAWKEAILAWSRNEVLQFGPLASRAEGAGKDVYQGQGFRDPIYGWPSVARCRVEDQVLSQAFADKGMTSVLTSARGLSALEYLLFYPGQDTACAATSATATTWATLEASELEARKLTYAQALSDDVRTRSQALAAAYAADPGEFRQSFVSASGYPSEQEALNVLAWALVYIEREVKDWKLGVPAGYTLTHPVGEPESPHAGLGTDMIRENLLGFRALYEGCGPDGEGLGFDDWLIEAGHPELAADMIAAWKAAFAAAQAFPAFPTATTSQVQALHASVKALTDLLKADFFGDGSPLALKLPAGLEGDTD